LTQSIVVELFYAQAALVDQPDPTTVDEKTSGPPPRFEPASNPDRPAAQIRGSLALMAFTASLLTVLTNSTLAADRQLSVKLRPDQKAVVFGRLEWVIDPGQTYTNPFDPTEVAIDAALEGPGESKITLPAFWSQHFTDNRFGHHDTRKATAAGDGQWLIRFCPSAAGRWSLRVTARDRQGERRTEVMTFEVAPSPQARGFIRRAPGNSRYLQRDGGQAFFPIGLNIAWPHNDPGLDEYEKWFKALGNAGGNFARVWMSHPNRMTETVEAGIGRFDLAAMEYYDEVMKLAEQNGLDVMLCLNNHRDLLARDQYGDSIWLRFPYNAANGGPATRPIDFINGQQSREFYKRRLRYLIARYSAFTNLAFWEFFNEQEFTRLEVSTDWMREMSEYLKQHDPYQHLVTTSAKIPEAQQRLESIDLTQSHLYVGGSADLIGPVVHAIRRHDKIGKPHVVGELGIGEGHDGEWDTAGLGSPLHNGMWASTLSGGAGSSWQWWWDSYVDPKNLWHAYTGLAKFAAAVDWPRRKFEPLDLPPPQIPDSSVEEFFDMLIACTENWGYVVEDVVNVSPSGWIDRALPHYIVGPNNQPLFKPVRLRVDLPKASMLVLKPRRVSDVGVIRVAVDDRPLIDFPFSALPGAADVTRTSPREGTPVRYEGILSARRSVEIPAGKHVITIGTVAGDWVSLESITLQGAQSSKHQLNTLALQDVSAGETLAWIYDTRSHWQSDRDGLTPRRFENVAITVPVTVDGAYTVQWWDTRSGQMISSSEQSAKQRAMKLTIPPFTRDIAMRVTRNQ
jgi:hypothetical protein